MSLFRKKPTGLPLQIKVSITVIIEPDDGGYHAYAPALKGLHVDGTTEKEAIQNATKAVLCYLESLAIHGEPLPVGPDLTVEKGYILPQIPVGALRRNLVLEWPTHQMSGTR